MPSADADQAGNRLLDSLRSDGHRSALAEVLGRSWLARDLSVELMDHTRRVEITQPERLHACQHTVTSHRERRSPRPRTIFTSPALVVETRANSGILEPGPDRAGHASRPRIRHSPSPSQPAATTAQPIAAVGAPAPSEDSDAKQLPRIGFGRGPRLRVVAHGRDAEAPPAPSRWRAPAAAAELRQVPAALAGLVRAVHRPWSQRHTRSMARANAGVWRGEAIDLVQ